MEKIDQLINLAIAEDVGEGDFTSLATIPKDKTGKAQLIVKQKGILSGIAIAEKVFHKIDSSLKLKININDGMIINPGDIVFTIEGNRQSILKAERLVLNFMQRMSGIATETNQYISLLKGLNTQILDTRKTTPGLRLIEKMAVKHGGGNNHRIGLYDMIMIKDNHIDYAGGIEKAIEKVNVYLKDNSMSLEIEIEARNLIELNEILKVGNINRIMLDNFSYNDLRKAVALIDGKYETEASGGITKETIQNYAECGVDYISVGALTHQIKSLDLSLKAF